MEELQVIDITHQTRNRIIFWFLIVTIGIASIFGIIKYVQYEEKIAQQHVIVSSIEWHDETRENFKITKLDDDTTKSIDTSSGVPRENVDVATNVTYSDGRSDSISLPIEKLQPLLNKTYSFRTSDARFAIIHGKIKESGKIVNQKVNRAPFKVGDSIVVSDFRKLEHEFNNNNADGANKPEYKIDVVTAIAEKDNNPQP